MQPGSLNTAKKEFSIMAKLQTNYRLKLVSKTCTIIQDTGGRLNKKDGLTRYGDFHVKDKTS